jgi:hypothetical protein
MQAEEVVAMFKKPFVLLGLVALSGCRSSAPYYSSSSYAPAPPEVQVGAADPGMADPSLADPNMAALPPDVGTMPPPTEKSFVDRHPILSAPRNYYRDSGTNPVVRVLAGTFVGIPVGVVREVWQIGYGQ